MNLLHELDAGLTWRRFQVLLAGLSAESVYACVMRAAPGPRLLTAADAPSFFSSFPKAGE